MTLHAQDTVAGYAIETPQAQRMRDERDDMIDASADQRNHETLLDALDALDALDDLDADTGPGDTVYASDPDDGELIDPQDLYPRWYHRADRS